MHTTISTRLCALRAAATTGALLACSLLQSARAQCQQWRHGFNTPGTDLPVYVLGAYDLGSGPELYCGGDYSTISDISASRIARFDGSSWRTLGSGVSGGTVSALAVFDDGTGPALYVGGNFTIAGGVAASCIARWNGASWSALGLGLNGTVQALETYDDGSGSALYVAGWFTSAGGAPANRIARWDGSTWNTLGSGMNNVVFALRTYDDGSGSQLYAGGSFTTAGGTSASRIARWDGSSWTALNSGVTGTGTPYVGALEVFDSGSGPELIVGGIFGFFTPPLGFAQNIARWTASGWSALGTGVNQSVTTLAVHDDGGGPHLFAAGSFSSAGGNSATHVARWNGSSWSALTSGIDGSVADLCSFDSGSGARLIAGGSFTHAGGVIASSIAAWDGTSWSTAVQGQGAASGISALCSLDFGTGPSLYAAGGFLEIGDTSANYVARWDGTAWSPLGSGADFPVVTLAGYDDGSGPVLYVGGHFQSAGGVLASYIARWNGSTWSAVGGGTNRELYSFATYDDGTGLALYVGGQLTMAGGQPANYIARWNGTSWSALGSGTDGYVYAMVVHDDGTGPALYVAGGFGHAGGVQVDGIARWNGTNWSAVGIGANDSINTLCTFDDGHGTALYAGGFFTSIGGIAANKIAKWSGSSWSALAGGIDPMVGPGGSAVFALATFDDGAQSALYVGGRFTSASGMPASSLARWNGSAWSAFGTGLKNFPGDPGVVSFCAHDDGSGGGVDLFIAGGFNSLDGVPSRNIGAWLGCRSTGTAFCAGDGSGGSCPCANSGLLGHGCENSTSTGGALLSSVGDPSLANDTLTMTSWSELPTAASVLLQGSAQVAPASFGDGLRCTGGTLKRLYVRAAVSGVLMLPQAGDPSISARSAALGDLLVAGTTRSYQTYYRDPNPAFCASPTGNTWNVSSGRIITWQP